MVPIDCDMFAFLWSSATVLFGSKQQLRKNSRPIPVRYQRQSLDDSQLTELQRQYIVPLDKQLETLGYRPFYTLRVTNYGSNLVRGYQNPADPVSCTLTIVEVQTNVKGLVAVKNSSAVNFTTRYDGGKELITRNMELKSVMEPPAYKIMQECPYVTNLTELKNRHDTKAKSVGVPIPPPRDVNSVITEFEKDHESFSNYQLQQGIYKLSPKGGSYVVTDKAFSRGIQNHFNPFARRSLSL